MKQSLRLIAATLFALTGTSLVYGEGCNTGPGPAVDCQTPGVNGLPSANITVIQASVHNSASGTHNAVGSAYTFTANQTDAFSTAIDFNFGTIQAITVNTIDDVSDVSTTIEPVVGNKDYYIYVQVCPGTGGSGPCM